MGTTVDVLKLADEIIAGKRLTRENDLHYFADANLNDLCKGADNIRQALCGNHIDLCAIINGRSGRCSENCKFCAQSAHHHTGVEEYDFLDKKTLVEDCKKHAEKGIHRYSIVTAGRTLTGKDLEKACEVYKEMHESCNIKLCASHGLLTREAFLALKASGVEMYHENIETSKRNFPNICTTHRYEDKIEGIRLAHEAGLTVCSGGIIGMGETFEDRVDMALSLSELSVESIPLNALIPIKGTALEGLSKLSEAEILRTVAMFRYLNPTAYIRLAAGRNLMEDSGKKAFLSGANATITGDMLTTSGNNINQDKEMLTSMGFTLV